MDSLLHTFQNSIFCSLLFPHTAHACRLLMSTPCSSSNCCTPCDKYFVSEMPRLLTATVVTVPGSGDWVRGGHFHLAVYDILCSVGGALLSLARLLGKDCVAYIEDDDTFLGLSSTACACVP